MKTQTQNSKPLNRKEIKEIQEIGEAKNIDSGNSLITINMVDGQLELEHFTDGDFYLEDTKKPMLQIGCGALPVIGRFKFSGSLN